jgi:hypothetical protein
MLRSRLILRRPGSTQRDWKDCAFLIRLALAICCLNRWPESLSLRLATQTCTVTPSGV